MNRVEHLLTCLGEEGNEVAQRVSKALRFGLREVEPGQPLTNDDRVCDEIRDLIAVAHILHGEGVIGWFMPDTGDIQAKRRKIERFMAISREQGVLS
ncbi:hypothetical protein CA223_06685 [Sphingomonas koreensis]|uniref:Uncharacterized protein n=1 Tax=Sphingomonas koreensis TaxID=93064 RepID=A0A1L6J7Y0_9SPHN|nr:hypothetical protein [Sphingomonas koreensis]APR52015.1 hypothetical protein BRX40_05800 [Sphingomonas koreensis]RSU22818.1 hypothetical protein CA224_05415 [Sphingomonas koreensis]RSU30708.1 hypothetical protein CA222_01130 [Sphingomonas koreensis]RSU31803.1 hypothetical protein CA225_00210 [Sphingomonas koreensis]RSU39276.1 hypothetical protein BRX39_01320 [Sphingomonas koreensis]